MVKAFKNINAFVSSSILFSLMDDSLIGYLTDSFGIINNSNLDQFFGATEPSPLIWGPA